MVTITQSKPVIAAMRAITEGSDRWVLADALVEVVPNGVQGLQDILDRAESEGVAGRLSVHTLRLYRDTAKMWPLDKRIDGVSFSAHREAIRTLTVEQAVTLLNQLARKYDKVKISDIRDAVAVKQGKAPTAPAPDGTPAPVVNGVDVLADLKSGAPQLINAIATTTTPNDLDKLQRGMSKALAHVESLKSKAARKGKSATKAQAPTVQPAARPAAAAKRRGDMRGL
jgi:hypothetical protein